MNVFGLSGILEIILVNCAAWLLVHLAAGFVCSLIPRHRFDSRTGLYRTRRWERSVYETVFHIRAWKERLPDCGSFRKKRMSSRKPAYLREFLAEGCRAELIHAVVILCVPLFIIWNNWPAASLMLPYVLLENLPCIFAQRYNRDRLLDFMKKTDHHTDVES
jgi:glycosyl-4,4'-diaponeurosporenoate acyltransferase